MQSHDFLLPGTDESGMKHANLNGPGRLQGADLDLDKRAEALARELGEALEQQMATSEVHHQQLARGAGTGV